LPASGVTLILAIVGVIFGHRALASALNEKSSVALPVICLVLGYGVALFIVVWLVLLIQAIRNGGQDTINDAGQQIIRRQLQIAPTLTIRPGFPVRIVVTRDLVMEPYRG